MEKAAAWQQVGRVLDPGAPFTAISHNARVQYTQLLLEFEKVRTSILGTALSPGIPSRNLHNRGVVLKKDAGSRDLDPPGFKAVLWTLPDPESGKAARFYEP